MLNIFSTAVKHGKGGISTALVGYLEAFDKLERKYVHITTHSDSNKLSKFLSALKFIVFNVRKDDTCWFHSAQWLSICRKIILMQFCKFRGAKIVFQCHSVVLAKYIDNPIVSIIVKKAFLMSDYIIVLSDWWEELLLSKYPELYGKLIVSPNPIDLQLEELAEQVISHDITDDTINVIAMSRLEEGKGFREVINSAKYLRDGIIIHIVGDGTGKGELEQLASDLGVCDRVVFHGWLDYSDKCELLRTGHLFCLPSKYDSFGMVYLEAMAANLPIVALNIMSTPYVVKNGLCGVLLDDCSPVTLANAIEHVVDNYSAYKNIGPRYVKEKFGHIVVAKKLLKSINLSVS